MAGKKTFTAGAVLTAADVNDYLMDQSVMNFASSAARASAIPAPTEGMVTYLQDSNIVESYDGANYNPIDSAINIRTAGTANYTFAAGDAGDLLQFSTAGTVTLTVAPDSTYTFPTGTQINILNVSAGVIVTAGGVGVTLNGTPGLKLRAQWSSATLIKRAADTWVIIGDLSA